MIFIFCALYQEASSLIKQSGLRKITDTPFTVYCSEGVYSDNPEQKEDNSAKMVLTITGAGEIAAAAAVSHTLTVYHADRQSLLINAGICAGAHDVIGQVFLINKITEEMTGHTYYPDILYQHSFKEKEIITVPKEIDDVSVYIADEKTEENPDIKTGKNASENQDIDACSLFDMESAAIYQAALNYLGPEQMIFLKAVSDSGTGNTHKNDFSIQSSDQIAIIEHLTDALISVIQSLRILQKISEDSSRNPGQSDSYHRSEKVEVSRLSEEKEVSRTDAEELAKNLSEELCCSETMKQQLNQLVRYAYAAGLLQQLEKTISELRNAGQIPAKDRKHGKNVLQEITAIII